MPCTTILVGKNATYDGSTMIARNDDAGGNDHFTPKKMIVVQPKEQPRVYKAVLSSVEIPLPEKSTLLYSYAKCGGRKGSLGRVWSQ